MAAPVAVMVPLDTVKEEDRGPEAASSAKESQATGIPKEDRLMLPPIIEEEMEEEKEKVEGKRKKREK